MRDLSSAALIFSTSEGAAVRGGPVEGTLFGGFELVGSEESGGWEGFGSSAGNGFETKEAILVRIGEEALGGMTEKGGSGWSG